MSSEAKRTQTAMSHESNPSPATQQADAPNAEVGKRTQRAALAVLGLLAVAFLIVFAIRTAHSHRLAEDTARDAEAPAEVDVATVRTAEPVRTLSLPGATSPWYAATIYARVDGYVSKWFVDIGDHVEAGQQLALIDTPDLDAKLAAAQAKLGTAEANVEVREAQAEFAGSTYDRWRDSPKGIVSVQETDDKKAAAASAKAALMAAQADVKQAQGEVDQYAAFEQFKKVLAPFSGVITERHVDIGNLVTAGSKDPSTMLYRLTQNDPIRVFVDAPQDAAPWMKVGSPVEVAAGGHVFSGEITRTSNAVDAQSRTLRVEADIPNKQSALVPGLYVDTTFHLKADGTSQVPAAAILLRAEGPEVAVVRDGKVEFHKAVIAEDNGTTVNLTSGAKPGDQVVLNINSQITDGSPVTVSRVDGKTKG